ncbi:sugar ABC transporter ATP-binding protein [Mesorhizobium sp.]|uniref:sugar ABC transporter ATP-binding protein n=1 Tax=Mesorhizobium sp. TaxID=1871066 RepID=UPI00257E3FEA|nr:sugar ABC transporter ATP-binding protein [Mesorhizobium sp.]
MAEQFALELRSVSRSFGAIHALRDVSFSIRAGEVMALMGENGAGKSTAVRIMSGFDTGYNGEVLRNGTVVRFRSPADAERQGVAIAQQELSQVATLSIAENIFLGNSRQPTWSTISAMAARARPFLQLVGLGDLDPCASIANLSVGERHLVEVARLMSREPDVLILDEPTAALGQAESRRILSMVKRLAAEQGKAIIYVSHRLDEIFEIADFVTVLRDGHSHPRTPIASLTVDMLVERMLGRPLENMYPDRRAAQAGAPVLEVENFWPDGLDGPVTLSVRRGEILGLAGQLGSGVSTLLAAIAGVSPRRTGSVKIDGRDATATSAHDAKRKRIAYCSSDRKHDGLFLGLSVSANLTAPALSKISRLGWTFGSLERRTSQEIARAMTIDERRTGSEVGTLSGGNQQKVALGKWMSIGPRLLLIDEPTRGVDVGARAEIYRRLRGLADDGIGIVIASTDLQEIAHLPDAVATFYRGSHIDTFALEGDQTARILKDITHPHGRTPEQTHATQ